MGEVAGGDAAGIEQFLCTFVFFLTDFQGRFVHFDCFGGIEYLYVQLGDVFLDGVFAFIDGEFGDAAVQLLLFDSVYPFAAVVNRPVGIDAVATVIRGFTFAGGDVVATDDRTAGTVWAVHDALADISTQGRKEIRLCRLYIFLCALDADAVTADGDVMLQGIINAITKRPLLRHVVLCFHSGRQKKQAG